MNIEKVTAYGNRNPQGLKEKGITNPVLVALPNRICFTDVVSAIIFDLPGAAKGKPTPMHSLLLGDFMDRGADVASFISTIGDLTEWLRKDTEPCTFCNGGGPCPSVEVERNDDTSSELEDSHALHYGWIGPTPVDRARLDELLSFTEAPPETPVLIQAVMNERPHQNDAETVYDFYSAVWVKAVDESFEIFLGGLNDKADAAPKFHLEGKFTAPEMKKSGKKKVNRKSPTEVFGAKATKKAAPKAQPKKAVAKPAAPPVKAAPKKPVTKTKVVSKTPPKPTGSSLLDRAMAKKAAGRKKK